MTLSSLAGLQSAFKRYLFAGDNEVDLAGQDRLRLIGSFILNACRP